MISILSIANSAGGGILQPGLSGGDRIDIEILSRWSSLYDTDIHIGKCGIAMYSRYNLRNVRVKPTTPVSFSQYSLKTVLLFQFSGILLGLAKILRAKYDNNLLIYSASDFPADLIPALLAKLRWRKARKAKWIASLYLFAENPTEKHPLFKASRGPRNIIYFLWQKLAAPIILKIADMVWVTNDMDKEKLVSLGYHRPDAIIAVKGGVDIELTDSVDWQGEKEFDAVFIGRLHPQKGVLELIDIWKYVCSRQPHARLAIIGSGELMERLCSKIQQKGLDSNVTVLGFMDGAEKIRVFRKSKVVVHPALYDSGGMAPCEAMACGLPGVSFDLPALRSYYPHGMLKTSCFDEREFADKIISLLENAALYEQMSKQARQLAEGWDWNRRARDLLEISLRLFREGPARPADSVE